MGSWPHFLLQTVHTKQTYPLKGPSLTEIVTFIYLFIYLVYWLAAQKRLTVAYNKTR